jgi:hypothetical protein
VYDIQQHEIEQHALWNVLKTKGSDQQRLLVKNLVDIAAPVLDRVIETFPTYTLHNSRHARNVCDHMARLLGPRLVDLSALEAALLILAAYFHDIGMVFKQEERAAIAKEPEWQSFLIRHPEAYLAVQSGRDPPAEIVEWYCRWRHADRVFVYLNRAASDAFDWDGVSIREELGRLCRSHNLSAREIQADALPTDFLACADLQLCAILLRLADILDFDRSRSPESVYKFLGLDRRDTPRKSASDVEWRKHLQSNGVVFPKQRDGRYELDFIAGPDHPAVEHDVRQFLDVIEAEIEQCRALLSGCSAEWRDFELPTRIKRNNIRSRGYRYGEYRFSLAQDNVLQLLMGENLYDSPFVFVRELLQNAIDASRLRRHLEHARGN